MPRSPEADSLRKLHFQLWNGDNLSAALHTSHQGEHRQTLLAPFSQRPQLPNQTSGVS